ncbi:MAG: protein-L-isoaspartate(D-aspartate) O-methyltransferase [archaeon]
MFEDLSFEEQRKLLVKSMTANNALKSESIKNAFLKVRRERFVLKNYLNSAYIDEALPLISGQTISQPSTISVMLELLEVKKGMKVLEVGSGCGYVLALLRELAGREGKVFGIELLKELFKLSKKNLKKSGVVGVKVFNSDGNKGLVKEKPFDRILISAACTFVPNPLTDQLKEGGILVVPVGNKFQQTMTVYKKVKGKIVEDSFKDSAFCFVPLKQV